MSSAGPPVKKQATSWRLISVRFVGRSVHIALRSSHVGGTNLRVCLVTLQGHGKFEITQTKYRLTEEQKQEDGAKLFDFCAECLQTFIQTNMGEAEGMIKPGQELALGFTVRLSVAPLYQR